MNDTHVIGDTPELDDVDRRLVTATQAGLPLVPEPFAAVGEGLGISAEDVKTRLQRMLEMRVIRRIAAVPNHYALGYQANGMSVWDVDDDAIDDLGRQVGGFEFVSHCYRRPRRPPQWTYNLFAMVHGKDRPEVERKVEKIAMLLGTACRDYEVLYSTRILKKTGLRVSG